MLGTGRFGTDRAGYAATRTIVSRWPYRVWWSREATAPVESWRSGRWPDGEQVVDVHSWPLFSIFGWGIVVSLHEWDVNSGGEPGAAQIQRLMEHFPHAS